MNAFRRFQPGSSLLAEMAMAVGSFGIGTGEFVIMGLLPDVAEGVEVSVPQAGNLITAYALGVVVGAPVIAAFGARLPRRSLLIVLMACFALGNLASALAPAYLPALAARFLAGLPHGAYFGVASLVAASLVGPDRRAGAVARVMTGLTVATIVGVPLGAWLGQAFGWRAAFALVAAIAATACLAIRLFVPHREGDPLASPLRELSALRRPQVLLTLGIGSVGFGGLFCVYTYIAPTMTHVAGLSESWVPIVLAIFGFGLFAGNLMGARLADRALLPTIGAALLWNIVIIGAFSWTSQYAALAMLNVLLIGQGGALVPALQVRLMDVAEEAQTLAAALNHSAFNIANGLGAWLGGVAISQGFGWSSTGWVGALMAVAGLAIFAVSLLIGRAPEKGDREERLASATCAFEGDV